MSTTDSDFSPTEMENPTPETITTLLTKMMKIMKEDKKSNEERFAQMQNGIDKRMENFVMKFKGSQKDEHSSVKTSSHPTKDKEANTKPSSDQYKIREANTEEGDLSEVSRDMEEKDSMIDEEVLQPGVKEFPHDIKQVSFPANKNEHVEIRKTTPRLTTPESAAPFDTITRLHLNQRASMISPYKARRQSTLRRLTEIGLESKPYLENTPENGHHQWGYSNKVSPNKIDLSQCTLKEDWPWL